MKTMFTNKLAAVVFTLALGLVSSAPLSVKADEIGSAKGGATKLTQINVPPSTTPSVVSSAKTMSCAKCKDEYVRRVDWTARGANKPTITVACHLCEGCGNEWVVSGHGKAKTSTALHKCTSCGAESLACCSTSKRGVAATKGMEKKFEVAPVK